MGVTTKDRSCLAIAVFCLFIILHIAQAFIPITGRSIARSSGSSIVNLNRLFGQRVPSSLSFSLSVSSETRQAQQVTLNDFISIASDEQELSDALISITATATKYNLEPESAIVFFSSAYESVANFDPQVILQTLQQRFPTLKNMIASTTGCPIGQACFDSSPTEIESRPGMSVLFLNRGSSIHHTSTFLATDDSVKDDIAQHQSVFPIKDTLSANDIEGAAFLFSTENIKTKLPKYLQIFRQKHKVDIVGSAASSISMLQSPKIYVTNPAGDRLEVINSGVVGLILKGDIQATSYVAKSVVGVGPVFEVTARNGSTVEVIQVLIYVLFIV